jgi:hypothetical protein
MIKFFGKVRQNLLSEGKTGKYLKYAVGEIILVMVGILLALQVNNWNESIKTKKEEKELLSFIQNAIHDDLLDLEDASIYLEKEITYADRILYYLEYESIYPDSLYSDFSILTMNRNNRISLNQVAVKSFEKKEDLIRNDSLRYQIMSLYNDRYPKVNIALNNFSDNLQDIFRPLTKTRFILPKEGIFDTEAKTIFYPMRPINYTALKEDIEFTNAVKTCRANIIVHLNHFNNAIHDIKKVKTSIAEELNE